MADKIRLLQVIGGGEFGGAERYVLSLVTHLDSAVFVPMVACAYEGRFSRALRAAGYPVWVLPAGLRGFSALAGIIRANGVSLVHTHGVRGNLFGRVAARLAGVSAVVTTVHSHLALDYPDRRKRLFYQALEALTCPIVGRYIVVSQALQQVLAGQGVDARRISVIPNGVDTDVFRPVPDAPRRLREELGLSPGTRLVGMVARLHPVKGHELFIRAAAVLVRQAAGGPPVRFLIVGGGEPSYRRQLEELSQGLGLGASLLFLGEREDVPEVLSGLDVAVVPSRFEGFSLAAIEAMACGVPVVAAAVGALPEIVSDGVNGLLARPGDCADLADRISALLSDGGLAARVAGQGLATARAYSVHEFARRTADLYIALLKERGRR